MEHKSVAVNCFNEAWNYLDKGELSNQEKAELLHLVHTSRYHWGQVGTILERARGEWQISRAYVKVGFYDAALLHANLCLDYSIEGDLGGFDIAFAYEAVARAKAGLKQPFDKEFDLAMEYANKIESNDDKEYTIGEIKSIRG